MIFCNSFSCPSVFCGGLERLFTRFCGSTVAESSFAPWVARVWVCGILEGGTTGCGCWLACEDECGGARSRDLDFSSLLERFLWSDGDEGFTAVKSSSDTSSGSGVTIGWICGTFGTCSWGCTRSRDMDRSRRLSSCGGWPSSPSLIGIWKSRGSGSGDRGCNRSRDVFPVLTLSVSPAGDGAGGHPSGSPGGPGGPGRPGGGGGPQGPKETSGSSKKVNFGGDGWLVSSPPFLGGTSWGWRPESSFSEHNRCPLTRLKCGAVKVELGYMTNPHSNWFCTGLPDEYPRSTFAAGRKDVKLATEGALKQHTALEMHIRRHMRWKILCNCRCFPGKDQLFPCARWLAFVNGVLNICS